MSRLMTPSVAPCPGDDRGEAARTRASARTWNAFADENNHGVSIK